MKKIILAITILFSLTSTYALDFVKGANVKDIHPRILKNLLRSGVDNFEGFKIVLSKDAKIPASFQKKWNERKLSGESIPAQGEASDDVIFIKSF